MWSTIWANCHRISINYWSNFSYFGTIWRLIFSYQFFWCTGLNAAKLFKYSLHLLLHLFKYGKGIIEKSTSILDRVHSKESLIPVKWVKVSTTHYTPH